MGCREVGEGRPERKNLVFGMLFVGASIHGLEAKEQSEGFRPHFQHIVSKIP